MNYDKFMEDHNEALDRFMEEYQKHIRREKDQFRFVGVDYRVLPEEIKLINENIVRIRQEKEKGRKLSIDQLDEIYAEKFKLLGDRLEIPVEGERVVEDIEEAQKILWNFSVTVGEWTNCYIKYFGYIDSLDGVHRYDQLLSLVHSNSQYHAIHIGIFRKLVLLRPKEEILLAVMVYNKSVPFLKEENVPAHRKAMASERFQMIYNDFFGVKYHVRLFLEEGDSILIAPGYLSRKDFNPSMLEECLLYPDI